MIFDINALIFDLVQVDPVSGIFIKKHISNGKALDIYSKVLDLEEDFYCPEPRFKFYYVYDIYLERYINFEAFRNQYKEHKSLDFCSCRGKLHTAFYKQEEEWFIPASCSKCGGYIYNGADRNFIGNTSRTRAKAIPKSFKELIFHESASCYVLRNRRHILNYWLINYPKAKLISRLTYKPALRRPPVRAH